MANIMKRLIAALGLSTLLFSGIAYAQFNDPFCQREGAGTAYCQNQSNGDGGPNNEFSGSDGVLYTVTDVITAIALAAAIIVIFIAAIMYVVSNGEPAKANRARAAIIYAMIGLASSMIVREVVPFVLNRISQAT